MNAIAEDRKAFIGGSEIAAVLGLSRYRTPLDVWAEKTGAVPHEDISKKIPVRVGNRLEETVCELFQEETKKVLEPGPGTVFSKTYPFLGATVDRLVAGEDAIFEAKTTSAYKEHEWEEGEWPAEYLLQVLWYLGVTGKSTGYIGCLIGNNKFVWKQIQRDERAIATMQEKAVRFWREFVVPKVMPSPMKAADTGLLFKLFPQHKAGERVILNGKASAIIEGLEGLERDRANLNAIIEQQKNELKAMLKDAELGEAGPWLVSWKTQKRAAYQVGETVARVLRYRKQED